MSKKILQSKQNDFPHYYKECCIKDLIVDESTEKNWTLMWKQNDQTWKELPYLKLLYKDIMTNGLIHPIIIWSPEKTLNVYIGRERVWIAKKKGYTHISAYNIINIEDRNMIKKHTTSYRLAA